MNNLERAIKAVRLLAQVSPDQIEKIAKMYNTPVRTLKAKFSMSNKTIKYIKAKLMDKAQKKYKNIYPVLGRNNFRACFSINYGQLYFWFNTRTQIGSETTHMEHEKLNVS